MKLDLSRFTRINIPADNGIIDLRPSAIYILPTPFGMLFVLLLVLLLIGSINYANNLAFLLTFFLASIGFVAMVHTWRNLVGLSLQPLRCEPVFAGEAAHFGFQLSSQDPRRRGDLELHHPQALLAASDFPLANDKNLDLELTTKGRGLFPLRRFRLQTQYPLGLFRAWTYIDSGLICLVYPRPEPWNLERWQGREVADEAGFPQKHATGQDFHGIRQYQPGDPPKRIHWQSLARGHDLMSREYERPLTHDLWLDLDDMPGAHLEARLQQLCHAALTLAKENAPFGIRLGQQEIPPSSGDTHVQQVLKALALYGKSEP